MLIIVVVVVVAAVVVTGDMVKQTLGDQILGRTSNARTSPSWRPLFFASV
jgi:hypothetical protein